MVCVCVLTTDWAEYIYSYNLFLLQSLLNPSTDKYRNSFSFFFVFCFLVKQMKLNQQQDKKKISKFFRRFHFQVRERFAEAEIEMTGQKLNCSH